MELFLTQENFILEVGKIAYGTNYVKFDSDEIRLAFERAVDVANAVYGEGSAKIINYNEAENEIEMTWSDDKQMNLTAYDLSIDELCKNALDFEMEVPLSVNELLFKYCKKISKKYGVKFVVDTQGQRFDGRKKTLSFQKQIEAAVRRGDREIIFNTSDVSVSTIRVYVSHINSLMVKKLKVSGDMNEIRVLIGQPTPRELFDMDVRKLWRFGVERIGHEAALEVLQDVVAAESPRREEPREEKANRDVETMDLELGDGNQYRIPVPEVDAGPENAAIEPEPDSEPAAKWTDDDWV